MILIYENKWKEMLYLWTIHWLKCGAHQTFENTWSIVPPKQINAKYAGLMLNNAIIIIIIMLSGNRLCR